MIPLWNRLPEHVASCINVGELKESLDGFWAASHTQLEQQVSFMREYKLRLLDLIVYLTACLLETKYMQGWKIRTPADNTELHAELNWLVACTETAQSSLFSEHRKDRNDCRDQRAVGEFPWHLKPRGIWSSLLSERQFWSGVVFVRICIVTHYMQMHRVTMERFNSILVMLLDPGRLQSGVQKRSTASWKMLTDVQWTTLLGSLFQSGITGS